MSHALPGGAVSDPATDQNLRALARLAAEQPNVIELGEQSAPEAPAENRVRIYAKDNGGKTQLLALFHTGEAKVIAEQP